MFIKYVYSKRGTILLYASLAAALCVSFALFRLPLRAVIYPLVLFSVIGAFALFVGYASHRNRYIRLCEISKMPPELIGFVPQADGIGEESYRNIVMMLLDANSELKRKYDSSLTESGEYYTAWVHQIKTPIASMRLTLQNEDTPLSRRLSSDLTRIEQYVGMVLAYQRLESPSGDYVFREYPLDGIIRGAVKRFAPEFIERRLSLEYSGTDKTVYTDEKWLGFVIEQVLSNAIKYTRDGGVRIYVSEPLTLVIEDTGIGIAPEDRPRVFEKGYTGYNGRTDRQASGLGLYLCRRICGNLGAKISLTSEVDRGTAVMIDLHRDGIRFE